MRLIQMLQLPGSGLAIGLLGPVAQACKAKLERAIPILTQLADFDIKGATVQGSVDMTCQGLTHVAMEVHRPL